MGKEAVSTLLPQVGARPSALQPARRPFAALAEPMQSPHRFHRLTPDGAGRATRLQPEEIEMNKPLSLVAFLSVLLLPALSPAQTMERPKLWEVGDKLTHMYVLSDGSTHDVIEEVVQVTDAEIRTTQRFFSRQYVGVLWWEFDAAYATADMACMKGVSMPNTQQSQFSPGEAWVRFPLEKGTTWTSSISVTGQTFVAETKQERKVEGVEQITTPAGEFTAFKVTSRGEITARSRDLTQGPWEGRERSTYWWTTIKGKLVLVKQVYENSFGERASRELVAAELK
jgi:hypothetical protein